MTPIPIPSYGGTGPTREARTFGVKLIDETHREMAVYVDGLAGVHETLGNFVSWWANDPTGAPRFGPSSWRVHVFFEDWPGPGRHWEAGKPGVVSTFGEFLLIRVDPPTLRYYDWEPPAWLLINPRRAASHLEPDPQRAIVAFARDTAPPPAPVEEPL